jgi:5-methylcytosine-specific restriction endonuclease McrA
MCEKEFTKFNPTRKYCSRKCSNLAWALRNPDEYEAAISRGSMLRADRFDELPSPAPHQFFKGFRQRWEEFERRCVFCQRELSLAEAEVEHLIPVSWSGSSNYSWNLAPACEPCNLSKSNGTAIRELTVREFIAEMRSGNGPKPLPNVTRRGRHWLLRSKNQENFAKLLLCHQ